MEYDKINELWLNNLQLKTFTQQDTLDYCQLNDINSDNITQLSLYGNELTDISGVKIFKNLEKLYLNRNKITDISVLKHLKFLKDLSINNNKITDISVLKHLINLKYLDLSNNKLTDISVLKKLTDLKWLNIGNLELESDQIQYINSLNNLEKLICFNGFKDMSVLKQLNNMEIVK